MNITALNWAHLQSFAIVVEAGSLSAGARASGSSQPTLSRHVGQLETSLGYRLFDRTGSGLTLTSEGGELLERAKTMADAAARIMHSGTDSGPEVSGTVRITASRIVASFLLPDILTDLSRQYPALKIEIVASDDTSNLIRREADIAVRMYRPTQNDVITRHLGDLELAAYAAPEYVARHGMPETPSDLRDHNVIGYDRSTLIIDGMRERGMTVTRDFFAFRSDDQVVCWNMVRAGFGIGFNQAVIGDADPRVVRVSRDLAVGAMPIWLTAHPDLRATPRIRRVFDALDAGLSSLVRRQK